MAEISNHEKLKQAIVRAERGAAFKQFMLELNAERSRTDYNRSKEAVEYWDILRKDGEHLLEAGWEGYENWVSAMSKIFRACMKLNRAISASDPLGNLVRGFILRPFRDTLESQWHQARNWYAAYGMNAQFSCIQSRLQLTDDGRLDSKSVGKAFVRDGRTALSDGEIDVFILAIEEWLDRKGYQARDVQGGKVYYTNDGIQLTQEVFEALLNAPGAPEDSLAGSLTQDLGMPVVSERDPEIVPVPEAEPEEEELMFAPRR